MGQENGHCYCTVNPARISRDKGKGAEPREFSVRYFLCLIFIIAFLSTAVINDSKCIIKMLAVLQ